MSLNTSATISSDVSYTVVDSSNGKSNTENGNLGFTANLVNGTGLSGIDSVCYISGLVPANDKIRIDFNAIPKNVFSSSYNVNFKRVKALCIENKGLASGLELRVRTTGTSACTDLFNGTGNISIMPRSVFQYTDVLGGLPTSSGKRYVMIHNMHPTSGIIFKAIIAGVSG